MNKLVWFIKRLFVLLFGILLSIFIPRNKNYIMFNAKFGDNNEVFLHNTKYFFLYLCSQSNFKVNWLCDNVEMIKTFNKYGYKNIYKRTSLKGIYYSLRSKYWFYDYITADLPQLLIHGATLINAWHGIPLKKILADNEIGSGYRRLNNIQRLIYKIFRYEDNYLITNNTFDSECFKTAFVVQDKSLCILGSPRLDTLYKDILNEEMFMEKDYYYIKNLKQSGKNIFIYMPTFRDTGKDISSWLKSEKLQTFLKDSNSVLVCKLHPVDKNSLNFNLTEEFYKMNNMSDIYPLLKYSNALITDYSSVYFDYLLLDKPIIYYVPDLQEYQEKCRGFYRPFEKLTAGIKTYTEEELITGMKDVINGIDSYQEKRKILRDEMFKYQDGNNCKRVEEFIRGIK